MSSNDKIGAAMILEVIGRPKENLVPALEEHIKKMSEEQGVTIVRKTINEPVAVKDRDDFFTTFAEVEVEVTDVSFIVLLMFKYMPAHIEIIYPEELTLTNNFLSETLSELIRRLHGYDEVMRVLQVEKNILEKKLREKTNVSKTSEDQH